MDSPVRQAFFRKPGWSAGILRHALVLRCQDSATGSEFVTAAAARFLSILELTRMKPIVRASLGGLCLVTVLLAITGAIYEMVGRWRDAQRFPQRGHLVEAGSIRMNIDCSGQGSPTVILESGSGGPSVDWLSVQPAGAL